MKKSDTHLSGYIYRKSTSGGNNWSYRSFTLSIDTGKILFYAEKNGIKSLKERTNIKKGRMNLLSTEESGKPHSFEVKYFDDSNIKQDEQSEILAAMDNLQLEDIIQSLNACFENSSKRNQVVATISAIEFAPTPTLSNTEVNESVDILNNDKQVQEILPDVPIKSPLISELTSLLARRKSQQEVVLVESKNVNELTQDSNTTESKTNSVIVSQIDTKDLTGNSKTSESNLDSAIVSNTNINTESKLDSIGMLIDKSNSIAENEYSEVDNVESPTVPEGFVHDIASPNPAPEIETPLDEGHDKSSRDANVNVDKLSTEKFLIKPSYHQELFGSLRNDDSPSLRSVKSNISQSSKSNASIKLKGLHLLNFNGLPDPPPETKLLDTEEIKARKRMEIELAKKLEDEIASSTPVLKEKTSTVQLEVEILPAEITKANSEKPKVVQKRNIKTMMIAVRPTETIRMGYLHKFNNNDKQINDDSWTMQFVQLDVSTAILTHFTEINGRRIQRGKVNILNSHYESIEQVKHGKEFTFQIDTEYIIGDSSPKPGDNVFLFAAEDIESLCYWLISLDDCYSYKEDQKRKQEELEMQAKLQQAEQERKDKEEATAKAEIMLKTAAEAAAIAVTERKSHIDKDNDETEVIAATSQIKNKSLDGQKIEVETDFPSIPSSLTYSPNADNQQQHLHDISPMRGIVGGILKVPSYAPLDGKKDLAPDNSIKKIAVSLENVAEQMHIPNERQQSYGKLTNIFSLVSPEDGVNESTNQLVDKNLTRLHVAKADTEPVLETENPSMKTVQFEEGTKMRQFGSTMEVSNMNDPHKSVSLFDRKKLDFSSKSLDVDHNGEKASGWHVTSLGLDKLHSYNEMLTPVTKISNAESQLNSARSFSAGLCDDDEQKHIEKLRQELVNKQQEAKFDEEISKIQFNVKKVKYPAERLSRRIKIWYCSSGFSLSTDAEVEQFVKELKQTGDKLLMSFAGERFENIQDWSNLLELLRKYEEKVILEGGLSSMSNEDDEVLQSISLLVDVDKVGEVKDEAKDADKMMSPKKEHEKSVPPIVTVELSDEYPIDIVATKLSVVLNLPEETLQNKLPSILLQRDNVHKQGLELIKDDLIFAEDLILYQEEVIDHLWESYSTLRSLVEQKDEVINQLTGQSQELQEQLYRVTNGKSKSTLRGSFDNTNTRLVRAMTESSPFPKEDDADKDGEGKVNRDEWRNWIEEKHRLIQSHNETKAALITEIRTLRKSLNPSTESAFMELKRSEDQRLKLEEEIVKSQIQHDNDKMEIANLRERLQDSEIEKSIIESHWQEKITSLMNELQHQKFQPVVSGSSVLTDDPKINKNQKNVTNLRKMVGKDMDGSIGRRKTTDTENQRNHSIYEVSQADDNQPLQQNEVPLSELEKVFSRFSRGNSDHHGNNGSIVSSNSRNNNTSSPINYPPQGVDHTPMAPMAAKQSDYFEKEKNLERMTPTNMNSPYLQPQHQSSSGNSMTSQYPFPNGVNIFNSHGITPPANNIGLGYMPPSMNAFTSQMVTPPTMNEIYRPETALMDQRYPSLPFNYGFPNPGSAFHMPGAMWPMNSNAGSMNMNGSIQSFAPPASLPGSNIQQTQSLPKPSIPNTMHRRLPGDSIGSGSSRSSLPARTEGQLVGKNKPQGIILGGADYNASMPSAAAMAGQLLDHPLKLALRAEAGGNSKTGSASTIFGNPYSHLKPTNSFTPRAKLGSAGNNRGRASTASANNLISRVKDHSVASERKASVEASPTRLSYQLQVHSNLNESNLSQSPVVPPVGNSRFMGHTGSSYSRVMDKDAPKPDGLLTRHSGGWKFT